MSDYDLAPLQAGLSKQNLQSRTHLLPALHLAQEIYGYIPEAAAAEISRNLGVPLADIHGVIEFYSMLYREPVGKRVIRVCTSPTCSLAGSERVLEAVCQHLNLAPSETSKDGAFTIERVPCLGLCDHAPSVLVNKDAIGDASPDQASQICHGQGYSPIPVIYGQNLLTVNCCKARPTYLEEYRAGGGYQALEKALGMSPATVIEKVKASGLVGRGGAAFPTGLKWQGAAEVNSETKYVVCNADESEPGTFTDRALMEIDPHCILEGLIISAYAVGAKQGFIYVRGEYPQSYASLQNAINEAHREGFLGENILRSDFSLVIEMRLGAGAYICGEETSQFESIEGKRGFPRLKPPYPTTHGLFGKPTVINNVETLANIPYIIRHGPDEYRQIGTQDSPGTKLFCLTGDVALPGLYELPFGVTLRELIYDHAGGMRAGYELQTVLVGGAAGAFATPKQLDLPLTFEDLRSVGLSLGSGALIVIDQSRDLRQFMNNLTGFFAHESCGKCYPCQLGTRLQDEIMTRIAERNPLPGDDQRLMEIAQTMTDASICGLGQTAGMAVMSALNIWPDLFTKS